MRTPPQPTALDFADSFAGSGQAPLGQGMGAQEAALRCIQLSVAPALPLEDVLREITMQAMEMTGARRAALWVRRNEPQENEPQENGATQADGQADGQIAAHASGQSVDAENGAGGTHGVGNKDADAWLCLRLPPDPAGKSGEAVASLAPAELEPLAAAVLRMGQARHLPHDEAVQPTQIALPLRAGAHLVGVLQLDDVAASQTNSGESGKAGKTKTSGPLRALEARLSLFCEQAAVTIANARLFQQLQNAKREWEVTFDGMLDGVCIERADGSILRVNQALTALLGLDMSEILGRRRQDLYARLPSYQLLRPLQRAAHDTSGLNVRNGEFRFGAPERIIAETVFVLRLVERRRRARRAAETGEQAIDDSSRGHTVCVLRDVTEQRRLQEQLLQSEKLAALGELVSGVAHELNNPLTTVVGYAQLLQDDGALPDTVRRQMSVIHTEAARASRIVGNLLAFARREEPRKTRLVINDALRPVVQMRAYQLQAHDTRIVTDFKAGLPPVWGDAHQLQQVFLNIINNAHQAMQEWRGGGEIQITTQPVSLSGLPGVRITIADNGPGIAPEHLRRVFDPFFTTKPLGEGTGLGMSLSLGIISNHEGRIWAESQLGHGARFIVELPGMSATEEASQFMDAKPEPQDTNDATNDMNAFDMNALQRTAPDDEPDEPSAPATIGEAAQGRPREILVVDDEEPVVTLITEVLVLDGHRVTPAFNGAEALALLQEHNYDLIISDVRMPAVGGPTFFEILQTTRPDLLPHVVFVTGDTVSPSTREFLRKARRPMLAKPFDPERLRALVAKNLAETAAP